MKFLIILTVVCLEAVSLIWATSSRHIS